MAGSSEGTATEDPSASSEGGTAEGKRPRTEWSPSARWGPQ